MAQFVSYDGPVELDEAPTGSSGGFESYDGPVLSDGPEPGLASRTALAGPPEPEDLTRPAGAMGRSIVRPVAPGTPDKAALNEETDRLAPINPGQDRATLQQLAEFNLRSKKPAQKVDREAQYRAKGYGERDAETNAAFDESLESRFQEPFAARPVDPVSNARIAREYNPNTDAARTVAADRDQKEAAENTRIRANAEAAGPVAAGLATGFGQGVGFGLGSIAFAADAFGADNVQKWAIDGYKDVMRQTSAMNVAKEFTELESAGDVGTWVAQTLAYGAYQAGEALLTGGLGSIAGKRIGREAIGQVVALSASNVSKELGSIYGDAIETAERTGKPRPHLAQVFGAAVAAASIDTLADKFGLDAVSKAGFRGNVATRMVKSIGSQAAVQGGTEMAQKIPEEFGAGKDPFREGMLKEYVNEGAAGALMAAGPGVMGGVRPGATPVDNTPRSPTAPDAPLALADQPGQTFAADTAGNADTGAPIPHPRDIMTAGSVDEAIETASRILETPIPGVAPTVAADPIAQPAAAARPAADASPWSTGIPGLALPTEQQAILDIERAAEQVQSDRTPSADLGIAPTDVAGSRALPVAQPAEAVTETMQPGDVVSKRTGVPYVSAEDAALRQRAVPNSNLVQVQGGWVVRPNVDAQATVTQEPPAAAVAQSAETATVDQAPALPDAGLWVQPAGGAVSVAAGTQPSEHDAALTGNTVPETAATAPITPEVLARVARPITADEVRGMVAGKTEKQGGIDPVRVLGLDDRRDQQRPMVYGEIPLSMFAENENGARYDGTVDEALAREYAARPGDAPPIIATVPRNGDGPLRVIDGGHRISAARIRGDESIPAIVLTRAAPVVDQQSPSVSRNADGGQRVIRNEEPTNAAPTRGVRVPDATAEGAGQGAEQGPAFRQSGDPAATEAVARVKRLTDAISARWKNAPPINVVPNVFDPRVPAPIQAAAREAVRNGGNPPDGVFYDGEVWMIADMIQSPQQAVTVLFHESLGHFGLRGLFKDGALNRILERVLLSRVAEADAMIETRGMLPTDRVPTAAEVRAARFRAAEEILAELAQTRPELSVVQAAIARIRQLLQQYVPGFADMKLTDNDIVQQFILPARAFVEQGAAGAAPTQRTEPVFSQAPPTDSPAFSKWFGDSKVVDAEGKPLVVYHGSPDMRFVAEDGVFRTFNERMQQFGSTPESRAKATAERAFFFTSSRQVAKTYADPKRAFDYQAAEEGVLPVYLSLQNPMIVDGAGDHWRQAQTRGRTKSMVDEAKAAGHDGVIVRNVVDEYNVQQGQRGRVSDVYVIFDSRQAKKTDNTTFDPANPDIRFSQASPGETAARTRLDAALTTSSDAWERGHEAAIAQLSEPIRAQTREGFPAETLRAMAELDFNRRRTEFEQGPMFADWRDGLPEVDGARAAMMADAPQGEATPEEDARMAEMRDNPANPDVPMFSQAPPVNTPAFDRWFAGSAVVNEDGTPKRVFHGTTRNFKRFDISADRNMAAFRDAQGFYFSNDPRDASAYTEGDDGDPGEGANVIPVYLRMVKPLRVEAGDMDNHPAYISAARRARMEAQGYDGIIYADGVEYVVFEPNQVKSIFNHDFDNGPMFSQGAHWTPTDPGRIDKFIYEAQDSRIDLKRTQEAITAAGATIDERFDARLAETLYAGRTAKRSQSFLEVEVQPLLKDMALQKVTLDEIGDYMHARAAEERNVQIAKVNPNMSDGGAGKNSKGLLLTTAAANQYLSDLPAQRRTQLERLAVKVDAITKGTREMLVREGLEKPETISAWEAAYKNYVPMFREEIEEGRPHSTGSGFTVRGSSSKRATGSNRQAMDIFANILMQREAAITRAEKNRVDVALYGLALTNPNPAFWTTIRPGMQASQIASELARMGVDPVLAEQGMAGIPTVHTVDPITNRVVDRPNPMYKSLPGAILFKIGGEDRVLMLNQGDPRAVRMAAAMKNMDGLTNFELAGTIFGKVTRWMAAVNTQFNPVFGMVNFIRDTLGGAVNLGNTPLRGNGTRMLGQVPAALGGIYSAMRGDMTSDWAKLYEQFQQDGGQTGFKEGFADSAERAKAIDKELVRLGKSGAGPAKVAGALLGMLDGFNTMTENAVRLSTYKMAIEQGISRPEAARLARELTVDFNRKGRMGREIGPLYAFFNAAVQGTERTIKVLRGPTGKQVIAGGLALGIMQALALAAAGFDDDEIPPYTKARNLVIPLPGKEKRYFLIPLPLGLHVLPNTGRILTEIALDPGRGSGKKAFDGLGEIAGAFNPLGGGNVFTGPGFLRTVAPTVADPIIEVATNENFMGSKIEREGNGEKDIRPGFARARESTLRKTTGQGYQAAAKAINWATGGNAYTRGIVSPSPEVVRHIAQTAFGGVLRETENLIDTSMKLYHGEDLKDNQYPVVSRLAGKVDDQRVQQSRYFENVNTTEKLEARMKGAQKARDREGMAEVRNEPLWRAVEAANDAQKQITALNKLAVKEVEDFTAMKRIDEMRTMHQRRLNTLVKRMEESAKGPSLASRINMVAEDAK